jgi:hypothetical protein
MLLVGAGEEVERRAPDLPEDGPAMRPADEMEGPASDGETAPWRVSRKFAFSPKYDIPINPRIIELQVNSLISAGRLGAHFHLKQQSQNNNNGQGERVLDWRGRGSADLDEQLHHTPGPVRIETFAARPRLPTDKVSAVLAQILPYAVDKR